MSRRTVLRAGAATVALVAMPMACGERPLPGALDQSGQGGTVGTATGAGGETTAGVGGTRGVGGETTTGTGGAAGLGGATGTDPACAPALAAGKASAIAIGTLSIVGGQMVIGRDSGGLYAMSALCTHQGCLVGVVGAPGQQTLSCPCHGSLFDSNGVVTRGPARTPLAHYQIDMAANGVASICMAMPVTSTTRTPIP